MITNEMTLQSLQTLDVLKENVILYVPSTIDESTPIDNAEYVEHIEKELSALFGGATSYSAMGSWLNNEGILIREHVTKVQSFTDTLSNIDIDKVIRLGMKLKEDMSQYAISLEVNGVLYFI